MNYTQLVADKSTANSIKSWVNWANVPSTDILEEAEAYIYDKLRVREMTTIAAGTIALNATSLALPTTYLKALSFRRIGPTAGRIHILDPQHQEERNAIDSSGNWIAGIPNTCQILDDPPVAYFDCKASQAIPYRLVYLGRKAALGSGNQTNFLTSRYPKLLRTACIMAAYENIKDMPNAQKYQRDLMGLITEANAAFDEEQQTYRLETHPGDD